MNKRTVRAIIKNSKDQFLLIERHKEGRHYFVLPGGHIDEGESPEEALVREILEETGFKVTVKNLEKEEVDELGNYQYIYTCEDVEGVPSLGESSTELKEMGKGKQSWHPGWFSKTDLGDQTVYPRWLFGRFIT